MIRPVAQALPATHPVASLRDIFWPRRLASSHTLLQTPGLELTYNGRGALMRACQEVAQRGRRNILLPAFHCPSGITPALFAGLIPIFYRIRRDLSIDYEDLTGKAGPETGAVLVIHFFGIEADLKPLQPLRDQGVCLIEDWSHSFLQGNPPHLVECRGDYSVFSFWKLVPSAVGGGLLRKTGGTAGNEGRPKHAPLKEGVVRLKRMLEESLDHSELDWLRKAFQKLESLRLALKPSRPPAPTADPKEVAGEDLYPFDPYLAECAMPGLARQIVEASDLAELAKRRRSNYRRYCENLKECRPLQILFPKITDTVCPWVFPVLLPGRDNIDHRWRAAGVALHTFGLHLHSALFMCGDQQSIDDAVYLSKHLLCLSIHQGLTQQEIDRSSQLIREHLGNTTKS